MKPSKSLLLSVLVLVFMSSAAIWRDNPVAENPGPFRFEVSFSPAVHPGPITGRVYVIVSKYGDREPRLQTGFDTATGIPIWGKNVESLRAGRAAVIDERAFGFPLESIREIPPGEYYVQGFVNL